ncbi:unnamed protein product [Amoebophrya sp. A25]|nr:unnamed protein product [Amoebophrya sp. A25]|eukprot:GSA25T00023080001.1
MQMQMHKNSGNSSNTPTTRGHVLVEEGVSHKDAAGPAGGLVVFYFASTSRTTVVHASRRRLRFDKSLGPFHIEGNCFGGKNSVIFDCGPLILGEGAEGSFHNIAFVAEPLLEIDAAVFYKSKDDLLFDADVEDSRDFIVEEDGINKDKDIDKDRRDEQQVQSSEGKVVVEEAEEASGSSAASPVQEKAVNERNQELRPVGLPTTTTRRSSGPGFLRCYTTTTSIEEEVSSPSSSRPSERKKSRPVVEFSRSCILLRRNRPRLVQHYRRSSDGRELAKEDQQQIQDGQKRIIEPEKVKVSNADQEDDKDNNLLPAPLQRVASIASSIPAAPSASNLIRKGFAYMEDKAERIMSEILGNDEEDHDHMMLAEDDGLMQDVIVRQGHHDRGGGGAGGLFSDSDA